MHADGLGDRLEVEGPQMGHSVDEERILLPHDLGGDLEDGPRPLLQASGEPVGGLQAFGQERLVALGRRAARDAGIVALVHQHAGQRLGVEFHEPGPVGGSPHEHVGDKNLHGARAEGPAGLGIETAQLGQHVHEVLVVDAAETAQARKIALGHEVEAGDQRLHRRIEPVPFAQLQAQAFGEIAGGDSGGSKVWISFSIRATESRLAPRRSATSSMDSRM